MWELAGTPPQCCASLHHPNVGQSSAQGAMGIVGMAQPSVATSMLPHAKSRRRAGQPQRVHDLLEVLQCNLFHSQWVLVGSRQSSLSRGRGIMGNFKDSMERSPMYLLGRISHSNRGVYLIRSIIKLFIIHVSWLMTPITYHDPKHIISNHICLWCDFVGVSNNNLNIQYGLMDRNLFHVYATNDRSCFKCWWKYGD